MQPPAAPPSAAPRSPRLQRFARGLSLLLTAVVFSSVAASSAAHLEVGSTHRYERPTHDRIRFRELLGSDREAFEMHVRTLANPFFEGRAPGTVGGDLAAEYLAFYFERLGLEPAFEHDVEVPGGGIEPRKIRSFHQPFPLAQGRLRAETQQLSIFTEAGHMSMLHGEDFVALGISGSGDAAGEVVFVGYSIESGPRGYRSYPKEIDLSGKIALMLRFEPIDEQGKSLWALGRNRWSDRASLAPKIKAAVDRGAAGIMLVSPPGADDPRAGVLQSPNETRTGRPVDIPVIQITSEVADRILKEGDPQGRDLAALSRAVAEQGECIALEGVEVDIVASLRLEALTTSNVAAILPGRGDLRDEYLVIGGHYDHVGYGYFGARGGNRGVIHMGADDNASGVAGTLVLASRFLDHYQDLPEDQSVRSIVFVLFGAEEMGLLGSAHFVRESPIPLEKTIAMLNMDMIGAMRNDELTVMGTGTATEFPALLEPIFQASGLRIESRRSGSGRSDEASFQRRSIPGLHFFSGMHDRYHTPRDRADLLNYEGALRIVDLVEAVALELASRESMLTYAERRAARTDTRRSDIRVRLGIAPGSFGADEGGVAVGQVFPGTSAADADLRRGDRIVRWNDEDVPDVGRWMELLRQHDVGDVVDLVVMRDGEKLEVRVVLKGHE